ncbi:MAG: DUF3805 domain-containing protein [Bacteroidetes bacterium]|jgi:hypothetical protein|nr:MAG: DUF3805 domain-containing protein [Bacteroidota bacterium]
MSDKIFKSQNGWFSLTLPIDWEEYDDDETDERTYAFFNIKEWTGNFRITPFRWTNLVHPTEDKAAKYIAKELRKNHGATKITLGDFDCTYYRKDFLQDGDDLVIYYWITGKRETLFICSFTIDKKHEETEQSKVEMEIVQDIIRSIQIN